MEELQATKSNTPPWVLLTFFKFTNGNKWRKASDLYSFFILHCYWSTISQTMNGKSLYCSSTPPLPNPFLPIFIPIFIPGSQKLIKKLRRKTGFKFFTLSFHTLKNGSLKLVSTIYYQIFISHQIIALQKL